MAQTMAKQQQSLANMTQISSNKQQNPPTNVPQSTSNKQQQPLDTLQSMINGVLIETGKALRSANRQGSKTMGHTQFRLQAFLPNAIDNFHLALDELESEIVRAKAVLGRDLRELQAKQHQIDNPITPSPESAGVLGEARDAVATHSPHATTAAISNLESLEMLNGKDTVTESLGIVNGGSPSAMTDITSAHHTPGLDAMDGVETKDSGTDLAVATSVDGQTKDGVSSTSSHPNRESPRGLGIEIANEATPTTAETPVAAGLEDTIGSLFSDNNDESDLNFDAYDFATGSTGHQNDDFTGINGGFDLSNFGNSSNNDNGDLNTYGNASGDDFNILDQPNNSTTNADTAVEDYGMSGGGFDALQESSFDDMLKGMEFGDEVDNSAGDETMKHGEFDEMYFGVNGDNGE